MDQLLSPPGAAASTRRAFLQSCAAAGAALTTGLAFAQNQPENTRKIKLGLDNFAVRDMAWNADQLIDYAASLKTDSLFITDLKPFTSRDDAYLRDLRTKAADKGLQFCLGSWSICPTSKSFRKDWGTAEEHLALGLRMAKALGSPVFRVILGSMEDRRTPGGIMARIEDTVKVCRALRNQALDSGVKIAVENHAGDMQAAELKQLIEAAGKDYVGANLDPGNATWTLEDPLANLEILGPYTVCTSMRDSMVWESANGATIQWTAMGEGCVDWAAYFKRFAELCPAAPVHIETISGFNREFPYLKPEFWQAYPEMRASDFSRFLALARKGKEKSPFKAPEGKDRKVAQQEYQRAELERSLQYCRSLGLGVRA
jgi:sugar phosphate isomerase/epimerase